MHVPRGDVEQFDQQTTERLMNASTHVWPPAFTRFASDADEVLGRSRSNRVHGMPGDYVAILRAFCELLGVDFDGFAAS